MREFNEGTGLERARGDTLYTVSVLEASGSHEKLLRSLKLHLERWTHVDAARRAAEDGIVRTNALVAWADHGLDAAVRGFANEVLRDVGGDKDHRTFKTLFPEAPNEVLKLGLESELEHAERLVSVAGKVDVSKTAGAKLAAVKSAMAAGRDALAQRRKAFLAQGQASLDAASWKEAANNARVSAYVQLQGWALANHEERSYADRFFAQGGHRPTKKAAGEPRGTAAAPKEEVPRG
ncbi:MAG: hypothetical protein HY909_29560 [Deltaproteobacteria bacterium]|nr:hypothetical protein [Deltaproteobacteria bacterium]